MESTQQITAEKKNVNSIFSEFWFVIPEYQRSYVWQEDNINDLLDDLWFAFLNKPENEYFLGSLVLKKTVEKKFDEYEVLDGQQRLTTFYLLLGNIRDFAVDKDLKDACREKIFQNANKFKGIPERERIKYKIRDKVEDFFKTYVIQDDGTKSAEKIEEFVNGKNVSLSNMAKAMSTIRKFLSQKSQKEIEDFAEYISIKPILIYVSTESREDAFRMFTILNNRGIPLTSADILKSMNIGVIEDKEKEKYAKTWEQIEGKFGGDFDRFLSFVRTILVKEKARVNLLEEYEDNIYKKSKLGLGMPTVDLLNKYNTNFNNVIKLDEEFEIDNDYKNLITIMLIGMPSEDWIPPLLFFYNKFGKTSLLKFLKKLEFKFSSDWVLQETPTQRIENMNSILRQIEGSSSAEEVLNGQNLFKVDTKSLQDVLESAVYGRRFARYILLKYEYLVSDNTVHLSDYTTISVEHILPQNPDHNSKWNKTFLEQEKEELTNALGNLCLISKRKNASLSNLDFIDKKAQYLNSRIDVFKGSSVFIHQQNEWTPKTIVKRQEEMLKKITAYPTT